MEIKEKGVAHIFLNRYSSWVSLNLFCIHLELEHVGHWLFSYLTHPLHFHVYLSISSSHFPYASISQVLGIKSPTGLSKLDWWFPQGFWFSKSELGQKYYLSNKCAGDSTAAVSGCWQQGWGGAHNLIY
jgi:hypothetical protein